MLELEGEAGIRRPLGIRTPPESLNHGVEVPRLQLGHNLTSCGTWRGGVLCVGGGSGVKFPVHVEIKDMIEEKPPSESMVQPWLVWLSGLSTSLQTNGSPVQFPVRAHA